MKVKHEQSPPKMNIKVSFTDTFQSSQQEKQQKHHIDRTLARGIIQNNSSLIVDEHHESGLANDVNYDTEDQLSKIVFQFRTKYDKTKTQTGLIEEKMKKMKEELEVLKVEDKKLADLKNNTFSFCKKTEDNLQDQAYNLEQTLFRHDYMKEMQQRLKNDIIHYKRQSFDSTIDLYKLKSYSRRYKDKSQRQQRLSLRCKTLLKSVQKTYNQNGQTRQKGIQSIRHVISDKREVNIKQKQREISYQQSMIEAMNTKLPQQKELIHVFQANKFMKKILNCKMQRLMNQYKGINDAFANIKQNTSTRTVQQFIFKFLHKDELYGQLLESISIAEPRIQSLTLDQKYILEQNNRLQHQKQQILQYSKNRHQSVSQEKLMKQIQKYNDLLLKIDKYRNGITDWAVSTISLYRGVTKSEVRSKYAYLGDLFSDCLKMILKTLQEDESKEKSIAEAFLEKQQAKSNIAASEMLRKNIRIKTLGNEVVKQDEDADYDLRSEKDFMNGVRRAVKKNMVGRARVFSKV